MAEVTRSKVMRTLFLWLQEQLFKKEEELKLKKMADLAQQNAALNNVGSCFLFEGVWYTDPFNYEMPRNKTGYNRILDMSLKLQAYEIVNTETFESRKIRATILNFFGKALQTCPTLECLNKVLPPDLHTHELVPAIVFNQGTPMTDEQIDVFKEDNIKGRAALNTIFLTELILARVV